MKQGKRSILFEWAGSYLIILLIPLITIFLNYYFNMETLQSEIYEAHEVVLDNMGDEINKIMNQQVNVYNYLYTDPFFASWVSHREKDAEFYYDASRLLRQVGNYVKYTSDLSCLMYMVDENYIVHNEYANNARHIHIALETGYEDFPEYEEWIRILSGEYNNEFLFLKYVDGQTDRKCLVYADSLELSGNKLVNIFVSVPMERIAKITESLDSKAYLAMMQNDVVEVIGDDEVLITPQMQEMISQGESNFETEEYMCIVKQAMHTGVYYCILVVQNDFWNKSLYIRNLFVISIVITVLVALGAVSFLLRKNFRPVSRLLETVSGEKKRGNEFYQLELAYRRLNNENKSMRQIIQGQKEALLGSYLLSVMQRRRKCLSDNEITFFDLEKEKILLLGGFRVTSGEHLLRFAVDNVFSELMGEEKFCRMEDGNYLLYLFFVSPEKEEYVIEKCRKQAEYMCELFREKWEVMLEFGTVVSREGMEQLDIMYYSLMQKFQGQGKRQSIVSDTNDDIVGIVADVLEYIDEHYSDSSLNISSIADSVNRNPKYISRVFKENMGEGILDYLNRIRIDRAKEIIATRRYSTEEAGAMAGYASNQTFRRAFIKIEGITPGKYMDSLSGNRK